MSCITCQSRKDHFVLRLEEGYCLSVLKRAGMLGWKKTVCETLKKKSKMSIILFYTVIFTGKSNTKSGVNLINIDDSQRLNRLFEKVTFRLANYLEEAWDMKKGALCQ